MATSPRHMIIDDNGVLWSSDSYDAAEEGAAIMSAVDEGKKKKYEPHIGTTWAGDLVFVQEIARTR